MNTRNTQRTKVINELNMKSLEQKVWK